MPTVRCTAAIDDRADSFEPMIDQIYELIAEVAAELALDPRTSVYEVEVALRGEDVVLMGCTSEPTAAEALHLRIAGLDIGRPVTDEVIRLPIEGARRPAHGIVTAALAPMLAAPMISETHLSQVLLGHRVLVLREHGRWLQCRGPDGYIGWIHRGYLRRVEESEARRWEVGGFGPLHFSLGAVVLDDRGAARVRLPWGARFGSKNGIAILPDGSGGVVAGDSVALESLRRHFPSGGEAVVATARTWCGVPYIWGGTTPWGADCSGLVQSIFQAHGIDLPRDSDQQAAAGQEVPLSDGFEAVKAGDLLFFAEEADRISHVAISTGGSRIIHSALGNGGVRENDLAGSSGYERELRSLLVTVRRFITDAPEP